TGEPFTGTITPSRSREREGDAPESFSWKTASRLARHQRWWWVPGVRCDNMAKLPTSSTLAEFLRQHEDLAGALDLGPAAVEFGDQRLQRFATRGAIERGLVRELIRCLMH